MALVNLAVLKLLGRALYFPVAKALMVLRSKRIYRLALIVFTFPSAIATFVRGVLNLDGYQATVGTLLAVSDTLGATIHKVSLGLDLYLGKASVETVLASPVVAEVPGVLKTVLGFDSSLLALYLLFSAFTTFVLYEYGTNVVVRFLSSTDTGIEHRIFTYPLLLSLVLVYSFRHGLGLGYLAGVWKSFLEFLRVITEGVDLGGNSSVNGTGNLSLNGSNASQ